MVFKNIQILSKSFWWIGECCAENSNIFISTSAPWVGTGQLLSRPGSALHIGKRMLMDGRNLRVCLLAAAGSRPVALRASSPRLAQLNGIKNQRMVRGQCAGWCRPPGEFQTTGNIWTHSWCAPSRLPTPHTPSQSIHCQSEPFPSQITFHQPGPARSRGGDQQTIAGRREMMK